ncbi:HpcH/HpaI aldolase/citrate lyase family protein [Haloplanus sp. GCM10025708]|uniref:HpcH/HpaI aldolase/citrate lyase family protein n=1 Tax=Haloferacaceae TaxID=1644056 RepID=UPI003618D344
MARRSLLFSPGDRPEMMKKAPETGADILVFDLEDAVAPARKSDARRAVRDVLADADFDPDAEVGVRVNHDPDVARDDLETILGADVRLDVLVIPKATAASDVETAAALAAEAGRDLPVFAVVENAAGVLAARDIAAAAATDALVFGAEDLSADLGATRTQAGTELLYARQHVLLAARAGGVDAIDTVYPDFEDLDGLAEEAASAATFGYDGKTAIHPAQVGVVNDAFTPAPERVEWAREVLAARDEADREGRGVFEVDGEMIDAPLVAQAERLLERADATVDGG